MRQLAQKGKSFLILSREQYDCYSHILPLCAYNPLRRMHLANRNDREREKV